MDYKFHDGGRSNTSFQKKSKLGDCVIRACTGINGSIIMKNKYTDLIKKETDRLIKIESKDIKPNEKIKVSYSLEKKGLQINVRKERI